MLKTDKWVIKLWWGILLVGKIIEFLATVGNHNPPVGKILTWTLKNHNLRFIIKHSESILGIMRNIWLWISENILLSTNFRKNTSANNFQKICQWWFSKLQRHELSFRGWVFIVFLYSQKTTKTCKKGALFLCSMCVMTTQPIWSSDTCRSVCTFSCKVLQILCFWLCTTMV